MKEFLGIGGYERTPEGALSWQHLTFVGLLMAAMIFFGIFLGLRNRKKEEKVKNRVLIVAAILIDAIEIFKLVTFCVRGAGIREMRTNLPLFLCSIQLIVIPLAAFSKGLLRDASRDFVFILGLLGAVTGTIGAFQNYNAYPVLGIENVASGLTHSIAGFSSLYIGFAGMASMRARNLPLTYGILAFFVAAAFTANHFLDYNYMFLRSHDGTPYSILWNLVGGHPFWYPFSVVAAFVVYIAIYYLIFFLTRKRKKSSGK